MAKIGIGSWAGKINVRLARGEVFFTIGEDENGDYKIDVTLPGALRTAKIKFMNLKEEVTARPSPAKAPSPCCPAESSPARSPLTATPSRARSKPPW